MDGNEIRLQGNSSTMSKRKSTKRKNNTRSKQAPNRTVSQSESDSKSDSQPLQTAATDEFPQVSSAWFALAVAPLLLAIVFSFLGIRPQTVQAAIKPMAFSFEEYLLDYGPRPVPPRPMVGGRFRFRNTTSKPLQVVELEASCGCMQPIMLRNGVRLEPNAGDDQTWQPGDYGEVQVRIRTANQSAGPHEYIMKMRTQVPNDADKNVNETDLAFKVVLPKQKIVIEPKALMFYQLSDKLIEKDIAITDMRGGNLKIERVQTSTPALSAKVKSMSVNERGMREIQVQVTVAANVPHGRTRGIVNLVTNDKTYPVLQVPIIIQGRSSPDGIAGSTPTVEPQLLVLQPGASPEILTGAVVLGGKSASQVRQVSVEPPIVKASFAEAQDEQGVPVVRVSAEVNASHVKGFNRAIMTIEMDGHENLEVPVMLKTKAATATKKTVVEK